MEIILLAALILSLIVIFSIDTAQKRRRFLAEQDR